MRFFILAAFLAFFVSCAGTKTETETEHVSVGRIPIVGLSTVQYADVDDDDGEEDGAAARFVNLFNGHDLTGWVNVNTAPDTFVARDGMIVSTGKPEGFLRTEKTFTNFILEMEWKHIVPKGNAGLFVWAEPNAAAGVPYPKSIEVQIMDGVETPDYTSQGDIFSIHGAKLTPDRPHPSGWQRCLPSTRRTKPAGEWNFYRVIAKDGALKLEINGAEVSGGFDIAPRTGHLCLEAEGSEIHYRRLRIKELP